MTPENFCYWLQGFFEISGTKKLNEKQVGEITNHLQLVFTKVTPISTEKKMKEEEIRKEFQKYIDECNKQNPGPYFQGGVRFCDSGRKYC